VTPPTSLDGRRVLVVGASSGIGRALATGAAAAGARVALGARRLALVEAAAQEIRDAGGEARAWSCDVTDEADCAHLVTEAATWMGGIDVVLYMAGSSPLVRVADAPTSLWHDMLATNVVGAAVIVRDAIEHLRGAAHPVVVVTTHSMGNPWPWLGVYGTTKAALAELARALRSEEPDLRVLCVAVGNTASSFADNWDPEVAGPAFEQWVADGLLRYEVLQCDEMADAILAAVVDPNTPDELLIAGAAVQETVVQETAVQESD
jgi:NAD(P)-dependent dehydrogenase (short-subunit alcohol dehydrogenase family)